MNHIKTQSVVTVRSPTRQYSARAQSERTYVRYGSTLHRVRQSVENVSKSVISQSREIFGKIRTKNDNDDDDDTQTRFLRLL